MNYIEKFLQELNIKRNECFKLRYKDTDETIDGVFYFDDNFFLKQRIGTMVLCIDDSVLSHLLIGDLIIEAPSFSPENGDQLILMVKMEWFVGLILMREIFYTYSSELMDLLIEQGSKRREIEIEIWIDLS